MLRLAVVRYELIGFFRHIVIQHCTSEFHSNMLEEFLFLNTCIAKNVVKWLANTRKQLRLLGDLKTHPN
jgi:hypothetical protein